MIPQPAVKIHLLDCKCEDCRQPIVLATVSGWLREYSWDVYSYSPYRARFKLDLTPSRGGAPDTRLRMPTAHVYHENRDLKESRGELHFEPPKLLDKVAKQELEVVLRTSVSNPPKDPRDILRFPANPWDWKACAKDEDRTFHYHPYWKVELEGSSVLNFTDVFTDIDTVLKVCSKPLEVLLRYKKEPAAMITEYTIQVQARSVLNSKDVEDAIKSGLHRQGITEVQLEVVGNRPYKPTSWRDVFDSSKLNLNPFRAQKEVALNAGYKFIAHEGEVFSTTPTRLCSETPICKVSELK